ncbi:hypothetical protein [Embleya sp. AB8]|uniref:hypothetical protein n=1 Tax=Embleya sp. AB8 TaxID=3156304 RepID=UPI003C78C9B4
MDEDHIRAAAAGLGLAYQELEIGTGGRVDPDPRRAACGETEAIDGGAQPRPVAPGPAR